MNPLLLPFVGADGSLTAWHSGDEPLAPGLLRPFLHVGSERQARSRAGRVLTRLTIAVADARRLLDKAEQDWNPRRLRRLAASGIGYGVYLNRHEGVDLDEVERARRDPRTRRAGRSIDGVPDRLFRSLVPSAGDSLIVVDPKLVLACETISDRRGGGAGRGCA